MLHEDRVPNERGCGAAVHLFGLDCESVRHVLPHRPDGDGVPGQGWNLRGRTGDSACTDGSELSLIIAPRFEAAGSEGKPVVGGEQVIGKGTHELDREQSRPDRLALTTSPTTTTSGYERPDGLFGQRGKVR
jgi:hypothetical protein